jgi:hypothetical protein
VRRLIPLLVLALAGCVDETDAPTSTAPLRRGCDVDDDCAPLRCVERACVGEAAPEYDLALRVVPPADSPSGEVEIQGVRFDDGPSLVVSEPVFVPDEVTVIRRVLTPRREPVAGTVTAVARDALSGRPLITSGATAATTDGARFSLTLAPTWPTLVESFQCTTFALRVVPDRERLPPFVQEGVLFGDCGSTGDVVLPADPPQSMADPPIRCGGDPGGLHVICGRFLVSRENPTPLPVQVFARDAEGRAVSTRAESDADGQFAVALWPSDQPRRITLHIESARPTEQPLPRMDVSVDEPATSPELASRLLPLYLGDIGRVFPARGRVVGLRGTDEEPLFAATVRFRGAVGSGEFVTSVETTRDGSFAANLYPGEYVIDVDPGATDFRLLRTRVTLSPDGAPTNLTLRPRTVATGRLVDPAGRPLADATISTTLVRARYADPRLEREGEAPPPRSDLATTDEDGRFTLRLDPGDHVLTVTPARDRGLPMLRIQRTVPADQPVDLGEIAVPSAAVLAFSLLDDREAPLSGVRVEAWALRSGLDAVLVGEGLSGTDGRVTVVVPAGPAPDVP